MRKKILQFLGPLLVLVILTVSLTVLHHALHGYHYRDVVEHLRGLPAHRILLALGLTVLSYFLLTLYDTLAARYIGAPLRYWQTALTAFIGYAFNNSIGFGGLAGNSLRYRLYTSWGLSAIEVTKLIGFCIITFWLGFISLGSQAFLISPPEIPGSLGISIHSMRPLGGLFLALIVGYLTLTLIFHKRPLRIREWEFNLPTLPVSLLQLVLASCDWLVATCVLYVLLPPNPALTYPHFLSIFLLAQIAGILSHVPGGMGVFEVVMTYSLHEYEDQAVVLAALLTFRVIYYLLPLIGAVLVLGTHEVFLRLEQIQATAGAIARAAGVARRWAASLVPGPVTMTVYLAGRWASSVVPNAFAVMVFIAGAILLFSGATPGEPHRLRWLYHHLPLSVINLAHFLATIDGMWLLLVARGIQRRLDAAYVLTVGLLGGGVIFSIFKGFDYEEAMILGVLLLAFLPCHPFFHRRASLISERFTPGWVVAILITFGVSVWLGFFSYKHVTYTHDLWWRFNAHAEASRFMRATLGAMALTLLFGINMLLRPAAPEPVELTPAQWDKVRDIIAGSRRTYPWSALLKDKQILLSKSENAFIMYGIEGRSWVALGDPVGPKEELEELVWEFRELSDRHGGWTIFYHVYTDQLPLYLDLGLTLLKLGEEAIVPLRDFTLEGSSHKGLRHSRNSVARDGYTFEIRPAEEVPPLLPRLRVISDAWLADKKTREKGFSLGFFDEEYLSRFPLAIVRRDEEIVAFANLWPSAEKEELSVDLMRYLPDLHGGLMDYLFINLMLWGKEQDYQTFNLGMAPLSGFEERSLAPLWSRTGATIFRHGEHFYNFQGLRQYKEKFDPIWEPKYLATPGGIILPRILTNIASLIAGGVRGIVGK